MKNENEKLQRSLNSNGKTYNMMLPKDINIKLMYSSIQIFTTASIPWYTGTSINPLIRAIHLAKNNFNITLYLPWLISSDQAYVFKGVRFKDKEEQEKLIQSYCKKTLNYCIHQNSNLKIKWYEAKYHKKFRSIYPIFCLNRYYDADSLIILEEPEHLYQWNPLVKIKEKHRARTIGICHTNYSYYVGQYGGRLASYICRLFIAFLIKKLCKIFFSLNRDVINYGQGMLFEHINGFPEIYGVNTKQEHIKMGTCYFIGKVIWAKGFKDLIDIISNRQIEIDIYGDGEDIDEIKSYVRKSNANLNFKGISSEPWCDLQPYHIFINLSPSEVLCSTTIEAILMRKWVILLEHKSNQFFKQFNNVITCSSKKEFFDILHKISSVKPPESDELLKDYSWAESTKRLITHINKM